MKLKKLFILLVVLLFSASSEADPILTVLGRAVALLTGTWAGNAAIVGGAVLGYFALAGKLSWFWILSYITGVVLIFGAADWAALWNGGAGGGLGGLGGII